MQAGQSRHPSRGLAATTRGQKTWRTTRALPGSVTDSNAATGRRREEGGAELGLFIASSSGLEEAVASGAVCETHSTD
jgi:hypothetical protein